MTAPDSRPIHDVIAEAAREALRQRLGGYVGSSWTLMSTEIAAAVVAACQQATVAQQAELTGGDVERTNVPQWFDTGKPDVEHLVTGDGGTVHDVRFVPSIRLVGPWREDPS